MFRSPNLISFVLTYQGGSLGLLRPCFFFLLVGEQFTLGFLSLSGTLAKMQSRGFKDFSYSLAG